MKKKARKVIEEFFKKAEDDSDINGSTGAVLNIVKDFHEPSDNVKHGLPDKKAASYPRGKTQVCSGKGCAKPATGGGLLCDSHRGMPKGTLETKEPGKVQYVDKYTQNQIWNADPRNKKQANENAPKDSPECGAVCQMRHNGMTEEEAMAHWNKQHKAMNSKANKMLKEALHPHDSNPAAGPEFSAIPGDKMPAPSGPVLKGPKPPSKSVPETHDLNSDPSNPWHKYPNANPGAKSSNDFQVDYLKNMNKNKPNPLGDFLNGVKDKAKSVSDSFAPGKHDAPEKPNKVKDTINNVKNNVKDYFSNKPGKHEAPSEPNHVQKFVDYLKNIHQKNSPKAPEQNNSSTPEKPSLFRPDGSRIVSKPVENKPVENKAPDLHPSNPNADAPPEFSPIPGDKAPSSGRAYPAPKAVSQPSPLASTNPATDARKERELSESNNVEQGKPMQPPVQKRKTLLNTPKSDREYSNYVNSKPENSEEDDSDYMNELNRLQNQASYRKEITSMLKTALEESADYSNVVKAMSEMGYSPKIIIAACELDESAE